MLNFNENSKKQKVIHKIIHRLLSIKTCPFIYQRAQRFFEKSQLLTHANFLLYATIELSKKE